MINGDGEDVGKVKAIQEEGKKVEQASQGQDVAISVPGVTFDRQLKEVDYLYSDLSAGQFKQFKQNKDLLTQSEIQALQKVAQIKRKKKPTWGV